MHGGAASGLRTALPSRRWSSPRRCRAEIQANPASTATGPGSQSLFPTRCRCPNRTPWLAAPEREAEMGLDPKLPSGRAVTIATANRQPGF